LTLTVKYQKQKFDVEKSHFKRGKIIYSLFLFSHIANFVNLAYIHTFEKLKILNSHNSIHVQYVFRTCTI
jgi:hypothetical protein